MSPYTNDKAPAASTPSPAFPALHLIPLNETFVPKQISLHPPGTVIKIGRQTNAKTVPNGTNGYFDSKVLSRMHAEVWSEDGKVLIKDVKSSNGTFIDGQRLSAEAAESDVFELRTGSTVEFGIDIVSDDSKTIVHHKVAAKVHCVMNAEDALASSREFNAWFRNAGEPGQRRGVRPVSQAGQQANGLSFDHVLNRLQTELQKSRDTGSHLGDLSTTLSDVHDTLGGAPPPANFHSRHPWIPGTSAAETAEHAQSIAALQSQLNETQSSLANHVSKIHSLEGLLAEHDVIKREVGLLRKQMEEGQRDMERVIRAREPPGGRESPVAKLLDEEGDLENAASATGEDREDDDHDEADDDDNDEDGDDTRSIASVDTVVAAVPRKAGNLDRASRERHLQKQNAQLSARLDSLSTELEEATRLGQSLRSQHAEATSTILALTERVHGLEEAVDRRVAEAESKVLQRLQGQWQDWREAFEANWQQERQVWQEERVELLQLVQKWRQTQAGSDEEDGADDGSGPSDDDDDESNLPSDSTQTVPLTAATSRKRSRSRRRRRSAAASTAALATSSGSTGSSTRSSQGRLAGTRAVAGSTDDGHSPSSTSSQSHTTGRTAGRPGSGHGLDHESDQGGIPVRLNYASAGAVVVVGVAAAWALSIKLKE